MKLLGKCCEGKCESVNLFDIQDSHECERKTIMVNEGFSEIG